MKKLLSDDPLEVIKEGLDFNKEIHLRLFDLINFMADENFSINDMELMIIRAVHGMCCGARLRLLKTIRENNS